MACSTFAARYADAAARAPPPPTPQFDLILGMDASNLAAIKRAAEHWRSNGHADTVPADYAAKLSLMTDHLRDERYKRYTEVPDPYYGGQRGFELVLDLLEDACAGLLLSLERGAVR
jgi:protein-tyrosine phosphatase